MTSLRFLAGLARAAIVAVASLAAAFDPSSGPAAAADGPVLARAVHVSALADRTRFVVELSDEAPFHVFPVPDPPRIVIDLAGVAFTFEGRRVAAAGLVRDWRFGEIAPGQARIVLDTTGPALPVRSFYLPPLAGAPGRLVVDIEAASPAAFEAALPEADRQGEARAEARAAAPVAGATDRPLVVIDPGHGGIDPGAVGSSGVYEKDLTLAFSLTLRDLLEARGKVAVAMTREDDRFVSLPHRIEFAREAGAGLFVSIHADAAPQAYVRGATVYTLSERPSDAAAAYIAERENRADERAGLAVDEAAQEVAGILSDLVRRETQVFSHHFARVLVDALGRSIALIATNPHRSARFRVLKAHDVPSVLVEIGYLSNDEDAALMTDAGWRLLAATAMAAAIERFFEETRLAGGAGRPGAAIPR